MRKKVALLADDAYAMRRLYRQLLEHHGYAVLEAEHGREAVALARHHTPDVIILDYVMPELDGIEAMRLLRADPRTVGIPAIALTSHRPLLDQQRAMAEGFSGYLEKSADPRRIVAEVDRLIGPPVEAT